MCHGRQCVSAHTRQSPVSANFTLRSTDTTLDSVRQYVLALVLQPYAILCCNILWVTQCKRDTFFPNDVLLVSQTFSCHVKTATLVIVTLTQITEAKFQCDLSDNRMFVTPSKY